MSGRKNIFITFGLVLSINLITSTIIVIIYSYCYSQHQFSVLNTICSEIIERNTELSDVTYAVLKEYKNGDMQINSNNELLTILGYKPSDFPTLFYNKILFGIISFLIGFFILVFTLWHKNKIEAIRLQSLVDYIEQTNNGKSAVLYTLGEDKFSKLEDEIYKTVTYLNQTKDKAVQARNDFAENLSNIAHQIKTPITAISLSVQMIKQELDNNHINSNNNYIEKITKQLVRLTHLEEALLVLARIDAGTLALTKNEVDVFTLLVLAAENLQELSAASDTIIDIAELGKMMIIADLDWTMEAVINLIKNCIEHNNGGIIHCSYSQNPLYTEILIWDEGKGFIKEDIPHIFERFYRGQNAKEGGIGIGLALSKEIIEHQNGTIRAKNILNGGALFEIRFYSH